jgi:hypothetical protein
MRSGVKTYGCTATGAVMQEKDVRGFSKMEVVRGRELKDARTWP